MIVISLWRGFFTLLYTSTKYAIKLMLSDDTVIDGIQKISKSGQEWIVYSEWSFICYNPRKENCYFRT